MPKVSKMSLQESDKAILNIYFLISDYDQIKQILHLAQNKSTEFVKNVECLISKYDYQNISQNLTPNLISQEKNTDKQVKQESISSAQFKVFKSQRSLQYSSPPKTQKPQTNTSTQNRNNSRNKSITNQDLNESTANFDKYPKIKPAIQSYEKSLAFLTIPIIEIFIVNQLVKLNKRVKNFRTTERYTSDRYTWNTENHKNLVQQKLEDNFSEDLSHFDNKQSPIRDIRENQIVEASDDFNDRANQSILPVKTSYQLTKQQQQFSEDENMNSKNISKALIKEQNLLQIDTTNSKFENNDCESFWNLAMQMESEPLKKVKFLDDEVKKEMQFLQIVNQPNNFEQSNNSSHKELTSIQQQIVIKKKKGRQAKVSSQQQNISNSRSPDIRQKSPDQKNLTQIISTNSHDFESERQYNNISKANFDISSRLTQFLHGIGKQNAQSSSMIEPLNSNSFVNEYNTVKQPRKIVISSKKNI